MRGTSHFLLYRWKALSHSDMLFTVLLSKFPSAMFGFLGSGNWSGSGGRRRKIKCIWQKKKKKKKCLSAGSDRAQEKEQCAVSRTERVEIHDIQDISGVETVKVMWVTLQTPKRAREPSLFGLI